MLLQIRFFISFATNARLGDGTSPHATTLNALTRATPPHEGVLLLMPHFDIDDDDIAFRYLRQRLQPMLPLQATSMPY